MDIEVMIVIALIVAVVFAIGGVLGWLTLFQSTNLQRKVNELEQRFELMAKQLSERGREIHEDTEASINEKTPAKAKRAAKSIAEPLVKSDVRVSPVPRQNPQRSNLAEPDKAIVFNSKNRERFMGWLSENWAYALGALSLALAGIYIVRLGMANGYFPPVMRIFASLVFGGGLIAAADWVRTRGGDEKDDATAYIPSSIASAGFATLFASIMGAQSLYHLITPITSFAGMAIVAGFAIVAGLRFGALLSAFGVIGAFLAPMLVGEASTTSYVMFGYALLVLAMTLVVDSFKRTVWLSVWGMVISFGFAILVFINRMAEASLEIYAAAFLSFGVAYLALCTIIPNRKLVPEMGEGGLIAKYGFGMKLPSFPARLVGGAMLVNVIIFVMIALIWPLGFWPIMVFVATLAIMAFFWLGQSPALEEYALVPLGMTLFLLFLHVGMASYIAPQSLISIVLLGMVLALSSGLAAQIFKQHQEIWRFVSMLYPLAFATLLLANWSRGIAIPYWPFFLLLFGAIALMLVFYYRKKHGAEAKIVDLGVLSIWGYGAMAAWCFLPHYALLIAFGALVIPLTMGAMRFPWRYHDMAAKIWTGLASGYAIWHGFQNHNWPHIAILAAFAAGAYWLYLQCKDAHKSFRIHFEAWGFVLVSTACGIAILRIFEWLNIGSDLAMFGVYALFFIAQIVGIRHRMSIIDNAQMVRKAMLGLYSLAEVGTGVLLLWKLPLRGYYIHGPSLFNDMLIGYLLPALALIFMHRYKPIAKLRLDYVGFGIGLLWLIMAIRHFWQATPDIGYWLQTGSGELYSYTALMFMGMLGAMGTAIKNNSDLWRRLAYGLIVLTGIKLYFVDMAKYEGVIGVIALFIFGVILIGFNFVDRKYKLIKD